MRDRRSNLARRPYKKARRDAKRAVVWSRVGSWVSLESAVGEELERAEETGARSTACRTVPNCGSLERGRRGVASQRHNGPR